MATLHAERVGVKGGNRRRATVAVDELTQLKMRYAECILYLAADMCAMLPGPGHCPSLLFDAESEGAMHRRLADLADKIDILSWRECGREHQMETGDGRPDAPLWRFPALRREAGPQCCPHCAGERRQVRVGGIRVWACLKCGNDAEQAEHVLDRRREQAAHSCGCCT